MKPSEAQQEVIDSPALNLLCVAGPGSGKTAVLIWRIEKLIRDRADPATIVVITFTNAAADEILRRLGDVKVGYCGTLHGYMLGLLNANPKYFSGRSPITVMPDEQTEALIWQTAERMNYKGSRRLLQSAVKNPQFGSSEHVHIVAGEVHRTMRNNNIISYDALLWYGLQTVSKTRVGDPSHLLIDEFQDASFIDNAIYSNIAFHTRFFIGDPDQAIFGWRGADSRNMLEFPGFVFYLQANFRCPVLVCRAANLLINGNRNRLDKRTLSADTLDGRLTWFQAKDEANEIGYLLSQIHARNGTIGVLCRTNEMVEHFSGWLGVTYRPSEPHDWKRTMLLLSLLADPTNDWLAIQWLIREHDKIKAGSIALAAAQQHISINSYSLHLPTDFPLVSVDDLLQKADISFDSRAVVSAALEVLQAGSSMADLLLALRTPSRIEMDGDLTVCTIHQAKGREFDHVFLPAFEQYFIPGIRKNKLSQEELEEERRIAYVAITRARQSVWITTSKIRRTRFWDCTDQQPSQFIAEMGITGE